ncbi:Ribonuclease P protein subunit p30 [Schistosoma japonicum]|uniref:Ribonuclease P protein subunit p30 n=1 Tax=Schistosoma japonicum TaxID=6182 RepID=A0A4Z2DHE5_SCHJA|nr:Ribonuclease P protein subunit p30 [Schistosoma japonicum]
MESKYFDLDIPVEAMSACLLARLLDCGYHYVAVNQSVSIDDFNFEVKSDSAIRKKNKEERQAMRQNLVTKLEPPPTDILQNYIKESSVFRTSVSPPIIPSKPRIFTRLTIHCNNAENAGLFFRQFEDKLNAFDIVSFCPTSNEAFAYACEKAVNIDLISLDLAKSSEIRLLNKQCNMMMSRGIHLEFQLAPVLRSSSGTYSARSVLSQFFGSLLCIARKSFTNMIVVSSGASSGWEIRRPVAVSAMLGCLGLQPQEATHSCLTKAPFAVVTHGLVRSKTVHGAAALLKLLSMPNISSIVVKSSVNKQSADETSCEGNKLPYKKIKLMQ